MSRPPARKIPRPARDCWAGEPPKAPDFSADRHKRYRPILKELVDAVKAGDLKALGKVEIPAWPSSSPNAMRKYRELVTIALKARAKADKAA